MTTVKLFSQNQRTIGTTSTLPVIGRVTFDEVENSIEVDSSLIDELRLQDFGIILLTADEVEKKKTQDITDQKKKIDAKKSLPSILLEQSKHPLQFCILALKDGRSKQEQELIDQINELHFNSGEDKEDIKPDFRKQLEALDEKDLDSLLEEYPKTVTGKLKTKEDKIDYLVKKK